MEVNYEVRITKAKSWVSIWNRRDLTLMGKVTIIKSLIYSQFSYLAIPLIKPSNSLIKTIDTLTFNFLWGCKRDKVKREVIKGTISEGGLGLFDFSEFLISLKLTLIKKLIDQKFTHKWKTVFVSQLKFPTNIEISIENGLASKRYRIVSDILSCYREWKVRVVTARDGCMNHVVWANNKITDIGSRIWNKKLISRDILYISDFINNDNSLMTYSQFRNKWNLDITDISSKAYVDIKMALRNFNCPSVAQRNITQINKEVCLYFFKDARGNIKNSISGRLIRNEMHKTRSPDTLPALREWSILLSRNNIDWTIILTNLFSGITNNYKLIQFQYKLLMRISTCKYMRYKMRIAKDNDQCSLCQGALETLEHIFIQCSHTNIFKNRLKTFINNKIDREYRDNGNYHFMICNHANPLVNYINLAAKWYISRNFQHSKPLIWDEFVRYTKFALNGDKKNICVILEEALKS